MRSQDERDKPKSPTRYSLRDVLDRLPQGEPQLLADVPPKGSLPSNDLKWGIKLDVREVHAEPVASSLPYVKELVIAAACVGLAVVVVAIILLRASSSVPMQSAAVSKAPPSDLDNRSKLARTGPGDNLTGHVAASMIDGTGEVADTRAQVSRVRIAAASIVATVGDGDVPWPIQVTFDGPVARDTKVVITGVPAGAKLSRGAFGTDGAWVVSPSQLDGLTMTLPSDVGNTKLKVALSTTDGAELAMTTPTLELRPPGPPLSTFGKNDSEEKARNLLDYGEARLKEGDVTGARMFFKRAADAGDAQAALAMGSTFDPRLFASLKVQGMTPDLAAARKWYQRAVDLGSKDANERLDNLKTM
jgi:hypothetical protein